MMFIKAKGKFKCLNILLNRLSGEDCLVSVYYPDICHSGRRKGGCTAIIEVDEHYVNDSLFSIEGLKVSSCIPEGDSFNSERGIHPLDSYETLELYEERLGYCMEGNQ